MGWTVVLRTRTADKLKCFLCKRFYATEYNDVAPVLRSTTSGGHKSSAQHLAAAALHNGGFCPKIIKNCNLLPSLETQNHFI